MRDMLAGLAERVDVRVLLWAAPALLSTGRIGSCAARRYHLVAVTPLDLGAILAADRP